MSARLVWVPGYLSFRKWAVVYYLHGQTGRSTVWENGNQSLGLVNVLAESRLPFVQISYICWKTATKAWNWYKRWLWRNGTWIPYRKNRTIFSEIPLLPEIFLWNDPESRAQFTFQPDFPETFCKWWTTLVYLPSKVRITIVSNLSWVAQLSQEEKKTTVLHNFAE